MLPDTTQLYRYCTCSATLLDTTQPYLIMVSHSLLEALHTGLHCEPVATFESRRLFVGVLLTVSKERIRDVLSTNNGLGYMLTTELHYIIQYHSSY